MKVEAPSSFLSPEEVWTSLFNSICERIGPCFARSETRERVQAYLRGLLSPVERKNGWQLAEEAGFSTPYAMQYLLNRAVWESDQVRDQLQAYVREMIGDPDGISVLDETGFLKKGKKSVGVQRQYSGTAGRYHLNTAGQASPRGSQGREKDRVLDSGRCFEPFVTRSPMGRSTLLGKSEGRCILLAC